MKPPLFFGVANPVWRFAAGFANLVVVVGAMGVIRLLPLSEDAWRTATIGFAAVYWVVSASWGRSIGSVLCMLDLRRRDMSGARWRIRLLHSLPYMAIAVFAYAPTGEYTGFTALLRSFGLSLSVLFLIGEGLSLMIRWRSLMDSATHLTVVRLDLPPHLRPGLFRRRAP